MPNDDLGQFPMPSSQSSNEPVISKPDTISASGTNMDNQQTKPAVPAFEETPDEIPSIISQSIVSEAASEPEIPPIASEPKEIPSPYIPPQESVQVAPEIAPAPQQPIPATIPQSATPSIGPVIFAVIFIVAVISLAGAAFLFQQTQSLKGQLVDITNTLKKQQTSPETTPTPSIVEVPTASPTISSESATPTATPTPTMQVFNPGSPMKPLSVAPKIMQIATKQQPNAQLILLKTDNANDPIKATTKYFFRQDLKTKKYFYILISGNNEPEVVDKQIFVTPDDNIPSLNDLVLENKLGIDLDEAIRIATNSCPDLALCTSASAKAQYIKTSAGVIWQISLTVAGKAEPMVMQIDAQTKTIIFKTSDFTK